MKPVVATADNNRCCAWTKRHERCRLALVTAKTCATHKNYYDGWLDRTAPVSGWRYRDVLVQEFRFQVEHGHVHVTNEYVQKIVNPPLHGHDYYSDFYEWLLHLPHIKPKDNIPLYKELILRFCILRTSGSAAAIDDFFGNLFRNPNFCPADFCIYLCSTFTQPAMRRWNIYRDTMTAIMEDILLHPAFDSLAYNPTLKEKIFREIDTTTFLSQCVSKLLSEQLGVQKQMWRQLTKSRFYHMKEEFIMRTWHPDRLFPWCFDEEEKGDFTYV
jgi:hypothetical protein